MSYRDIQMIIASQIAYMDFDRDAVDSGTYTVKELLDMELEGSQGERRDTIQKLLDRIAENSITQECGNWKIKDIRDNQSTSGMYACLLDTGDGNALVAFRGSESDNLSNVCKDWIQSDFGLINSVLTPQQITAEQYMRDIYQKYGKEFTSFSTTGHSLGGNLAEHAVITAPDGMRNKIDCCVNLDGPGFSNQYLTAHANDIQKSQGQIKHYQWSWCGRLFNVVPGSYYQTIKAQTPDKGILLLSMGWRHDTYNVVEFDENGNAIPGKPDWFAIAVDPLAKTIDYSFFLISGGTIGILYNTIDAIKDGLEGLWRKWEEIRMSYWRQAEFELNAYAVEREIEQLSDIIPQMREIVERIEQIQRELAFQSIAAGYVKVKLWSTANHIGQDAKKMEGLCRAGKECTQCYQSYEQKIVDNYV
nr:Mbeg1-like protein [uncultured Faecalicatena sp.]